MTLKRSQEFGKGRDPEWVGRDPSQYPTRTYSTQQFVGKRLGYFTYGHSKKKTHEETD